MRSDIVGTGKCVKMSKMSYICAHRSRYRRAMDMGPPANERGRQTTYTIRRLDYLEIILGTWCRKMSKNVENQTHLRPRIQIQTRYEDGSGCM
jgi:hypothetical protein